jgi:hypothetical protein
MKWYNPLVWLAALRLGVVLVLLGPGLIFAGVRTLLSLNNPHDDVDPHRHVSPVWGILFLLVGSVVTILAVRGIVRCNGW